LEEKRKLEEALAKSRKEIEVALEDKKVAEGTLAESRKETRRVAEGNKALEEALAKSCKETEEAHALLERAEERHVSLARHIQEREAEAGALSRAGVAGWRTAGSGESEPVSSFSPSDVLSTAMTPVQVRGSWPLHFVCI
jgi:hypothetical protein